MNLLYYTAMRIAPAGFAGLLFWGAPLASAAQELSPCVSAAMVADGTTDSRTPCTAPKRAALLELGYRNVTVANTSGFGLTAYPAATVRYGVTDALELNVSPGSYERVRAGTATAHGYGDTTLGARYRVFGSGRTVVSAIADISVASGDVPYGAGKPQYFAALASAFALRPGVGVQASVGYASRQEDALSFSAPAWYATYSPAIALIFSEPRGSSFYVEGSGTTKAASGAGPEYKLGVGARRALGKKYVIDLGLKDGLTLVRGSRSHELDVAFASLLR